MIFRKITFLCALLISSLVLANDDSASNNQEPSKKPPKEAFTACVDKSEGDNVSFTTPRGKTVEAICTKTKKGLVARRIDNTKD